MEKARKLKIILFSILSAALCVVGIVFAIINSREENLESVDVLGKADISEIPYITSLPVGVGYVGKEYVYDVRYSYSGSASEGLSISIVDGPNWLQVAGFKISGIVPEGSEGQYSLNVRITDGTSSSVQENYILIQSNEAN